MFAVWWGADHFWFWWSPNQILGTEIRYAGYSHNSPHRCWYALRGVNVNTLEGHTERVCCLQFDSSRLLSGSQVKLLCPSLCQKQTSIWCFSLPSPLWLCTQPHRRNTLYCRIRVWDCGKKRLGNVLLHIRSTRVLCGVFSLKTTCCSPVLRIKPSNVCSETTVHTQRIYQSVQSGIWRLDGAYQQCQDIQHRLHLYTSSPHMLLCVSYFRFDMW